MEGINFEYPQREYRQPLDVVRSVPLTDILRPSISGSALAVPIDSGLPYTNFKYVSGIPSSDSGDGYSMSKLQALDVLISRLVALQQQEPAPKEDDNVGMTDEALDELIKELGRKLSNAMEHSIVGLQQDHGVQMGTPVSHTGLVLNSLA